MYKCKAWLWALYCMRLQMSTSNCTVFCTSILTTRICRFQNHTKPDVAPQYSTTRNPPVNSLYEQSPIKSLSSNHAVKTAWLTPGLTLVSVIIFFFIRIHHPPSVEFDSCLFLRLLTDFFKDLNQASL